MSEQRRSPREVVGDLIVQPMLRHCGTKGMEQRDVDAAMRDYTDLLQGYNAVDLRAGWLKVFANLTARPGSLPPWPTVKTIVAAVEEAKKVREGAKAPKIERTKRDWQRVRKLEAQAMQDLEVSQLGRRAKAEGWWMQLETYWRDVAGVQAQVIDAFECRGLVLGSIPMPYDQDYRAKYQLEALAQRGAIDIALPISVERNMKMAAAAQREHATTRGRIPGFQRTGEAALNGNAESADDAERRRASVEHAARTEPHPSTNADAAAWDDPFPLE